MIEEAEYTVQAKLTTIIAFSPIERATLLSKSDAIENARCTVSDTLWEALEAEGWSIEFTAERSW